MSGIAINCIDDLVAKISKIPSVKGKVFHVYSEEELTERCKGITSLWVGVVYDGLRAISEGGKDTHKIGGSAELVASVIILFRQDTKATIDPKETVVSLLDTIRKGVITTKSPSGHFWKFQVEAAVEGKSGVLAYVQRWATPVQLV